MKVLIVDDHALFREGLVHVLHSLDADIVTLEASNYDSALELMDAHADLDFVLLDLKMPGLDGYSLLETAKISYPELPIAVLSASKDRDDMKRALGLSAVGFVPKNTSGKLLFNAIKLMLAGGTYLPAEMVETNPHATTTPVQLTPRQLEVLKMIAAGLPTKIIAADLGIAEATIKMHISAIFKSLGVNSRTQAALVAMEKGLN